MIENIFVVGLVLLSFAVEACLSLHHHHHGLKVFDVTHYGAVGDGKTDNAKSIMSAWSKACKSNRPAKLLIPQGNFLAGEIALEGPCMAAKPINIELQGTLLAQKDLNAFKSTTWMLISNVDGLVFKGGGTLNGQGQASWLLKKNGVMDKTFPDSIEFKTTNTIMRDISLVNSKGKHMKISDSRNFIVQNLTITAPEDSPNTDGIHVGRSHQVKISNSVIGTGDDCIAMGDGSIHITISNIKCGPGHGISIGSLGKYPKEENVKGIVVKNVLFSNTTNGARIKTFRESASKLRAFHIVYENIAMIDVENPIIIDQNYFNNKEGPGSNVKISHVQFRNIRGTTVSKVAVTLNCSERFPCKGIKLADIDLSLGDRTRHFDHLSSQCANVVNPIFTGKQNPPPCI